MADQAPKNSKKLEKKPDHWKALWNFLHLAPICYFFSRFKMVLVCQIFLGSTVEKEPFGYSWIGEKNTDYEDGFASSARQMTDDSQESRWFLTWIWSSFFPAFQLIHRSK